MKQHSRNVMQTNKKSFNLIKSKNDTTLKQKQKAPRFTWEIKGQYKADNPTLKKCSLRLNGKLSTLDDPDKNLLNKRSKYLL